MKKIFFVLAASVAALAMVSCDKNGGKDEPKVDPTGGVDVAAKNLVAYLSLDSKDKCSSASNVTLAEVIGQGDFTAEGARGGCYVNKSNDHGVQAGLKFNVPANFLKNMTSFTFGAWMNAPTQRGAIVSFDGGTDANWGELDLFLDGGNEDGTVLKGYFFNSTSEWGGFFPNYKGLEVAQNKWVYVTLTYDETTSEDALWVNGVKVFSSTCYAGPKPAEGEQALLGAFHSTDVTSLYVGAFASRETGKSSEAWLSYFGGKIDEIRIFNKALSEDEVMELYKAEVKVSDID